MEDEIDLRKYIDVLRRRWKLIVSITVIAVFVAGLVSFVLPPVYEARAAVLITGVQPEIVFEPEYMSSPKVDGASQRQALVALVKSDIVADSTIAKLGDRLEPGEQRPENMLNKVQVGGEQGHYLVVLRWR